MSQNLTIFCDSGLQKMLTIDEKFRDYLVFRSQSNNGQTGQSVSVVVSRFWAKVLRDKLNEFLEETQIEGVKIYYAGNEPVEKLPKPEPVAEVLKQYAEKHGMKCMDVPVYVPLPDEVDQAILDAERMNENMRLYGCIDKPKE